ncbi:uncharacterized protein PRCAT00001874001 [Priceomyces carsonii]|uniref:uncharacterized protein n=1 Tax=Priceomyces carsonii TaxID=28549 RepID=UPI002ED93456|nr:unnamed protein product [Priceomyces carsonii]
MYEVINVSLSQRSNHVSTHLYNNQESHIPYKRNAEVKYDNLIFLSALKNKNGTTNYSPRAIIYDLNGGLGSLGKYEYHEPKSNISISNDQVIRNHIIEKNDYQINLDKGMSKPNLLNVENTKYWTDYNKLIYRPKSLNELQNWKLVPGKCFGVEKHISQIEFCEFRQGQSEYKNELENNIDLFRSYLEECDLLQGVSLMTETDSAWGGFTNELILSLKDEYFNNGSNSKYNIWTYGLLSFDFKLDSRGLCSRISSIVELSKNSSLFFPMNLDPSSSLLDKHFVPESLWHSSSIPSIFVDSIWGLNNKLQGPQRMSLIEDNLLRGDVNRNIINEIAIRSASYENDVQMSPTKENVDINVAIDAYYSKKTLTTKPSADLSLTSADDAKYFVKNFVILQDEALKARILSAVELTPCNTYEHSKLNDITNTDTFPKTLSANNYYVEFNINSNLRKLMKSYHNIVSRSKYFDQLCDDKSELVEDICMLVDEYTIGYDLSDDDFE